MMSGEIREQVLQLMQQKEKIENEIKQLTAILNQNGVGMQEPLVDPEGFPLNSVDVYQVRHARRRIICLQNDHKGIMKQIEDGLQGYYSSNDNRSSNASAMDCSMPPDTHRPEHDTPFAKVSLITSGSPAESAGFHQHDLIVEFGSVNSTNFENINNIAAVVQHSEGCEVKVVVKRGDNFIPTILVPQRWQGKGLLGCSIVTL